jgi:hypothetical protein
MPQTMPQLPQLFASVVVSSQLLTPLIMHCTWPLGH